MAETAKPFWQTKTLEAMSDAEWESLCDGCGRCCLMKLEDEESGDIVFTDVACTLFDGETCRCKNYETRADHVPDCVKLTPQEVRELTWLPPTCAYRLVQRGQALKWWHPLVSGRQETVIEAGISVKGRISTYEHDLNGLAELEQHVVDWPIRIPRKPRAK